MTRDSDRHATARRPEGAEAEGCHSGHEVASPNPTPNIGTPNTTIPQPSELLGKIKLLRDLTRLDTDTASTMVRAGLLREILDVAEQALSRPPSEEVSGVREQIAAVIAPGANVGWKSYDKADRILSLLRSLSQYPSIQGVDINRAGLAELIADTVNCPGYFKGAESRQAPWLEAADVVLASLSSSTSGVVEALDACEEYFEQRADAEYLPGDAAPTGNEEMRLLVDVREALQKMSALTGGD